jgi:hypothetical protein
MTVVVVVDERGEVAAVVEACRDLVARRTTVSKLSDCACPGTMPRSLGSANLKCAWYASSILLTMAQH